MPLFDRLGLIPNNNSQDKFMSNDSKGHLEYIEATSTLILQGLGESKKKWDKMIRNEGSSRPDMILFRKSKTGNRIHVRQPAICIQWSEADRKISLSGGIVGYEDEEDINYFVKQPLADTASAIEYAEHEQAQKAIVVRRLTEVLPKHNHDLISAGETRSDKSRIQYVNISFTHLTGAEGEHLPHVILKRDRGSDLDERHISSSKRDEKVSKPLAADLLILHQELCSDGKSYTSVRYQVPR
jgi:hypothetical protein